MGVCSKWENLSVCIEGMNGTYSRRHRRESEGSESHRSSGGPLVQHKEQSGKER